VLRRDFLPRLAVLEIQANREQFRWTQARKPSEYVAKKVRLLRMAGVNDEKRLVEEIHAGFTHAPELQGLLETSMDQCKTLGDYRTVVNRFQDIGQGMWNNSAQSKPRGTATRSNWNVGADPFRPNRPQAASVPDKKGEISTRPPPRLAAPRPERNFKRNRKCRNFPRCGDGEHWDDQCPLKSAAVDRRAYYGVEPTEAEREEAEAEAEYAAAQEAFYAARGRELDPLTARSTEAEGSTTGVEVDEPEEAFMAESEAECLRPEPELIHGPCEEC